MDDRLYMLQNYSFPRVHRLVMIENAVFQQDRSFPFAMEVRQFLCTGAILQ